MFITDAEMSEHRADAESRMGSENGASDCVVRRVDPANPVTDANGFEVDGWADVYSGPFRLGGSTDAAQSRSVNVGDVQVSLAVRVANFPVATTGLRDGDVIEVTGGENTGGFLRIVEASFQDQATARRLPVIETQRPAGWT